MTVLCASGLACVRGQRMLWRGLDVALDSGDALYVTGPNGTGKTSLLRVLAGLLPAFAGRVDRMVRCGIVDEALALDRELPLAAALTYWARIDGQSAAAAAAAAAAVADALDRLALAHLAEVPPRYLSTGQRKRAAMARLLIADAPLWLLDEPANGLDRDGVALLERLIAQHRAHGGAIILASHLPLALPDSTTLAIMDHVPCG